MEIEMRDTATRINNLRLRALDALEKMEPEKMDIRELAGFMSLITMYYSPYYGLGLATTTLKEE